MQKKFWAWYERNYLLNISVAAGLFVLQLFHLYWLTAHVVSLKLLGNSYFDISGFWYYLILIIDYTEIPAIITTSLVYINELRQRLSWKSVWFFIFLNTQWLHIFWITDEFVVDAFLGVGAAMVLPIWFAWVAILIDYLELPVIADTLFKLFRAIKDKKIKIFLKEDLKG